jgi:hypothetical protein
LQRSCRTHANDPLGTDVDELVEANRGTRAADSMRNDADSTPSRRAVVRVIFAILLDELGALQKGRDARRPRRIPAHHHVFGEVPRA